MHHEIEPLLPPFHTALCAPGRMLHPAGKHLGAALEGHSLALHPTRTDFLAAGLDDIQEDSL